MACLDLTMTEQCFITTAGLESNKSDLVSRHGCVCVMGGKIIGRGHNSSRTQSKDGFINNTCSCHAEIAAIRNAIHNTFTKSCMFSSWKSNPWVLPENFQKSYTLCCTNG